MSKKQLLSICTNSKLTVKSRTLIIVVKDHMAKLRLDRFLFESGMVTSRSRATQLIDKGLVMVNEKRSIKPSLKVSEGDHVQVEIPEKTETVELAPLDIELEIVYDDEDLCVVNKPSGLVVHPAAGHAQDTLVNALIHQVGNLSMGFGQNRPGIVHRLDKDTSGLLVVAKNDQTHEHLARQFKEKTVHRIYKAIVYGHPTDDRGTIESYLIRHPIDRKRFCSEKVPEKSLAKGKRAVTHFQVENLLPCGLSLISCRLETGRTHQIRVHLFENQHGIIGDPIYNSSGRLKNLKSTHLRRLIKELRRIALHAEQLGFIHPKTGKQLKFQIDWPTDMNGILSFLKLRGQN